MIPEYDREVYYYSFISDNSITKPFCILFSSVTQSAMFLVIKLVFHSSLSLGIVFILKMGHD